MTQTEEHNDGQDSPLKFFLWCRSSRFRATIFDLSNPSLRPSSCTRTFLFGTSVASGTGVALLSETSAVGEETGAVTVAGAMGAAVGVETLDGVDFALEFF